MNEKSEARSRWVALMVLCAGMLMIVLDATVVNVALPAIQRDLGFSQSSLAWVVNAYLIAFGGLLLLAGRLGDLVSRRGVFLAGLAVFTGASVVCGVATSQVMLIAARFVQGVGGAMTSAVILGMIVTMFTEPAERAKAIGVYSFVASAGGSVGLLAGGILTQGINWHWIFFINVPIGVATAVLAARLLPRDRNAATRALPRKVTVPPGREGSATLALPRKVTVPPGREGSATLALPRKVADIPGAVLITSSLMLTVYTIVGPAASYGWGAPTTLALGGTAVALLIGFLVREATAGTPLVPLRIFRSRNVSGANTIQALTVAGMFGMFFLGVLYVQQILGYDALTTGLAFLPTTIVMGALSLRYSERIIMRYGAKASLLSGLSLIAVGLALFARVPVHGNYLTDVLPSTLLIGTGVGVAFPALANLAMSGATPADAGLASGLVNTSAQVGAALGLAVLATLSATRTGHLLHSGADPVAAMTGGYRLAFLIGAALVLVSMVVAVLVIQVAPARRTAPEPEPERQPELVAV